MNLTSIKDDSEAAWLHYRDSIEVVRHLSSDSVVDMGSGAGFPGIPLAIVLPTTSITLVEPRRKRVSFLRVATSRLGLTNVSIKMGRSDEPPVDSFGALVTRATFSDDLELHECLRWIKPGGSLIAFRSDNSEKLSGSTRSVNYELGDCRRRFDIIDLIDN